MRPPAVERAESVARCVGELRTIGQDGTPRAEANPEPQRGIPLFDGCDYYVNRKLRLLEVNNFEAHSAQLGAEHRIEKRQRAFVVATIRTVFRFRRVADDV